ncbi:SH3 domain-containing protein [Streptomyces sp. NBC_01498]|uniref:SH3 domain-containing protein n=1 Tax=Streptomyces sp. NBC_01498 TaxID=2975870 RepID=UPI002E7B4C23|nr:SH3 domain-containing protein [Streptomyces sp. NBC_01498]WTL24197.1 SH3 domain-containing protein [Streptomyces sp. NBC_01498]
MTAPHAGHRIASVFAGVLLAGTALAAPAVADDHRPGPASVTAQDDQAQAAAYARGRVIAHPSVLVRKTPNRNHPPIGEIPFGTYIDIKCKVNGEVIDGNPRWYLLKNGGWVSARWVENVNGIPPWCRA